MRIRLEDIACDLVIFEELMQKCRHINNDSIDLAEKAAEMYKGMLFEDSYYSWITEAQQHYELSYLELLHKMVDYFKQKVDPEKEKLYTKRILNPSSGLK